MEDTIKMHERLSALEQDKKSTHRRLDNLEKLVESVHTIATEIKQMRGDVNDVADRVNEMERRPIKRYDAIVTGIISSVISFAAGYFLG